MHARARTRARHLATLTCALVRDPVAAYFKPSPCIGHTSVVTVIAVIAVIAVVAVTQAAVTGMLSEATVTSRPGALRAAGQAVNLEPNI